MLDIWIADILILATVAVYPIFAIKRIKPRLLPGNEIAFPDWQTLDAEYRKRYLFRLIFFRIVPLILAVYFGYRMATWPSDVQAVGLEFPTFLRALFAAFVFAMIGASAMRIRDERCFVKEHPEFADSFLPVRPRIAAMLPTLLSIACVIGSLSIRDLYPSFLLLLLGLVGIDISRRLRMRSLTRSRYELPWDEPLGTRIAEVLHQFGFQPKKLILLPNMIANAYALPDGSVLVTSALRTLATKDEVAATVAHELSHVRDREAKKLGRARLACALVVGAILTPAMIIFMRTSAEAFLPPFLAFSIAALSIIPAIIMGSYSRGLEFKCDRDAARLGLASSLASCLEKMHAFVGNPRHWIGLDRYTLTHPSLAERVAELEKLTPPKLSDAKKSDLGADQHSVDQI